MPFYYDVVTGLPPDLLSQLVSGGTVGLILALVLGFALFVTGRIRRGSEADDWKAIATTSTEIVAKLVPAVEKLAASVEKLITTADGLVRAIEQMNREAELRREFERDAEPPVRRRGGA